MLYLTKGQLAGLVKKAEKEYPNEACGIIAGIDGKAKKIYPMTNTDQSQTSYFMDARQQFEVMKDIRKEGLEMIAIYHSHPGTEGYPSPRDIELAFYPEASYLVVSLKNKNNPEIRSFKIKGGKVKEEAVECLP